MYVSRRSQVDSGSNEVKALAHPTTTSKSESPIPFNTSTFSQALIRGAERARQDSSVARVNKFMESNNS